MRLRCVFIIPLLRSDTLTSAEAQPHHIDFDQFGIEIGRHCNPCTAFVQQQVATGQAHTQGTVIVLCFVCTCQPGSQRSRLWRRPGTCRLRSWESAPESVAPGSELALAPALAQMTGLECLDLYGNEIDPKGAAALAAVLPQLTGLKELSLSRHNIGDAVLMIMRLENLAGFDGSAQGQGSTDRAPEKRPQAQQFTLIF